MWVAPPNGDMIAPAEMEQGFGAVPSGHGGKGGAVRRADPHVGESGLARGLRGPLADRVAGQSEKRPQPVAAKPGGIGAGEQDRVEGAGIGRRPVERARLEQGRDDRLQPQRPGPRGGLVGAGLGADDQQLHRRNIARKAGLACARSRWASSSGSPSPAWTSLPSLAQDFGPERSALGEGGDGGMAIAAERGEEGALGADRLVGRPMIDRGEQVTKIAPFGQYLDADRALRRRRQQIERRAFGDAEPVQPGRGEQGRVDLAAGDLGEPGLDVAADRDRPQVRPPREQLRGPPRRGGADDRALRQRLDLSAPISRSRVSARSSIAAIANRSGRIVSTSFIEWTERSVRPSARQASSSLVHSALPPTSASGRSWITSPEVVIGTISIAPSFQPCAARNASATRCAWTSASGEPRVPMRSGRSIARLC